MMMTMMMMMMKMPITEPTAAGMSKEADYMYTLAIADTKFINNSIAIILHCSINDTLIQISAQKLSLTFTLNSIKMIFYNRSVQKK